MSERFSRRLPQKILSVRLPTALVSAPTSSRSLFVSLHSCRTPFSQRCHRQCRPSNFRHACVFGQTVEQALTVRDHSDGQVLLSPFAIENFSPDQYLTQYCSRVFCQVKSVTTCTDFGPQSRQNGSFRSFALPGHERDWNGFSFLQIVLSHHTHQCTMLRTDTDTICFALANDSSSDPSSSGSASAL